MPALIAGLGLLMAGSAVAQTFTTLHNFAQSPLGIQTNRDGIGPTAGLILSGDTLYGTTAYGGVQGSGTVFAIKTNGMSFVTLHTFTNSDGINPYTQLSLSSNTLYGTTENGGLHGSGVIFAINTDGTGFTNLHHFTALVGTAGVWQSGTNSEGGGLTH